MFCKTIVCGYIIRHLQESFDSSSVKLNAVAAAAVALLTLLVFDGQILTVFGKFVSLNDITLFRLDSFKESGTV